MSLNFAILLLTKGNREAERENETPEALPRRCPHKSEFFSSRLVFQIVLVCFIALTDPSSHQAELSRTIFSGIKVESLRTHTSPSDPFERSGS